MLCLSAKVRRSPWMDRLRGIVGPDLLGSFPLPQAMRPTVNNGCFFKAALSHPLASLSF
jgi:hypothetical protein